MRRGSASSRQFGCFNHYSACYLPSFVWRTTTAKVLSTPTNEATADTKDLFYSALEDLFRFTRPTDLIICLSDFNAVTDYFWKNLINMSVGQKRLSGPAAEKKHKKVEKNVKQ
ncbi:hypothetical protein HELRODRAFT_176066 [Helobdella robusta]|uniref:Uncharacterized protein n=1 Tax=Helobdella robusta TaxID=6412 RepID=T1FA36_HELRO|nr:hypothetical protein HELRODRAFT_176066 [Helobdella robusta]ESO00221.1 hypothetical protein HELRODRAFT_176066 [Helobdella robusta]